MADYCLPGFHSKSNEGGCITITMLQAERGCLHGSGQRGHHPQKIRARGTGDHQLEKELTGNHQSEDLLRFTTGGEDLSRDHQGEIKKRCGG